MGKNPEDVWDIPNVNSNHIEKTIHPCQFPVGLIERLVLALSNEGDLVFDPFAGVASTGVAGGSYNLSRIPLRPEQLSESMNINNKIAILFGREGDGISNKEIENCDICVSIPTDPTYPILNISHAAAIIFYELFKNKHEFPVEGLEESSPLEKEYLIKDMAELIDGLDIPDHKKKNGLKTFKNIINRAFITGREAHTFKGILRRLKNKME